MEFAARAASDAYLEELSHMRNKVYEYESTLKEMESLKKSASEASKRQEEAVFTFGAFKDAMELNKEIHERRINDLVEKSKQINQRFLEETRRSRELESANREMEFAAEVRNLHIYVVTINKYKDLGPFRTYNNLKQAARDAYVAQRFQLPAEFAEGNGHHAQNGNGLNGHHKVYKLVV